MHQRAKLKNGWIREHFTLAVRDCKKAHAIIGMV